MMFTNENRKTTASVSAKDLIQHIKEAEAKRDQLEARNKELIREIAKLKMENKNLQAELGGYETLLEWAESKATRFGKMYVTARDELAEANTVCDIRGRRIAGLIQRNNKLEQEIGLLKQLAKDLFARLKSWQQIAKHQFRKNKELEIEAYDRIRELEEELFDKDWLIQQQIDQLAAYQMWEETTTMGSILAVAKEIAGYEMQSSLIEDWHDRSVEYEITRQELNDEIICGLGYIVEEATELYLLAKSEAAIADIEDRLEEIEDVCNRILYPFRLELEDSDF